MTVKIVPVSEVRQKIREVLATLDATGEPCVITQYSRPRAILIRYEDYKTLAGQAAEGHPHITRRSDISGGEPIIRGTRIPVRHIVERIRAGQSVDDILAALPHLTAAQIYDALAYYYDHQDEIDALMEESHPERITAVHNLKVENVAAGVAVVHD